MTQLSYTCTLFFSLFLTAFPFLLLGIFVSSWLLVFVDEHKLMAKFPRNRLLGAIVGSSLGMIIPVCQYGNIPIARRLLIQGSPLSVAISFLLAAPTLNPIVIWLTWKAFPENVSLVLYRILLAWLIAIILAVIFSAYPEQPPPELGPVAQLPRPDFLAAGTFWQPHDGHQSPHRVGNLVYEYKSITMTGQPLKVSLTLLAENVSRETIELGSLLIVGCAIASVVQSFLPLDSLLSWGQTPGKQIVVMMVLSAVLSLGSAGNSFFVSGLTPIFLPGSLLSFLLLGSILDLKGLGLMFSTLRPKSLLYLAILVSELTFFAAVFLNFYSN